MLHLLPWQSVQFSINLVWKILLFLLVLLCFISITRVWFNDSWFVFCNSGWSFHESYCSRKHFTNNLGWTGHKIVVLKPANKLKIIQQCHNFENILINDFPHHQTLFWAKVLKTSFSMEPETTKWYDETINYSRIFLFFDSLWCQKNIL